jgi:hypothetical protein
MDQWRAARLCALCWDLPWALHPLCLLLEASSMPVHRADFIIMLRH